VRTRKINGQIHHESKLVPEFAIEVLDPLTPEELAQLARQQMAAQGL
jgi:Uma2 family endonuclease